MTSDQPGVVQSSPPAAGVRVRPLVEEDWVAFRALRLVALSDTPEAFGASHIEEAAQPDTFFRSSLSAEEPNKVFGAFSDSGDLVGIAGFRATFSAKSRHKGVLWGVYVVAGWRGDGVGRALVGAVIAHATRHVLVLQARVVTTNRAAHSLYARLGFAPYGIESKALYVNSQFYDEALLALDFTQATDA